MICFFDEMTELFGDKDYHIRTNLCINVLTYSKSLLRTFCSPLGVCHCEFCLISKNKMRQVNNFRSTNKTSMTYPTRVVFITFNFMPNGIANNLFLKVIEDNTRNGLQPR